MTEVFIRTPTGWAPLGDGGNGEGPLTASETWDLHWKGAWRNNVTYIEDDVVSHAGEYWITPEDLDAGELAPGTPSMPLEITHNPGSVQWTTPQVCKSLTTDPQPWSALNFQSGNQAGWAYFYFNVQTGGTLTVDFVTGQNGEWHHYPASGTALGSHTGDDTLTVTAQRYYIRVWGNYSDMSGTIKLTPGTAVLAPPAMSPASVWQQTWLPHPQDVWEDHWKGLWISGGTYVEGDVVYHDGDFYIVEGDDMAVPDIPGQPPFAPGFVASATSYGTGNVNVAIPTGSQPGDQMLIITSRWDGQPGPLTTPTIPTGFTRVTTARSLAAYATRVDLFEKTLTAGDISTGNVTVNISSQTATVHARTYRGYAAPSKISAGDFGYVLTHDLVSITQAIGDKVIAMLGSFDAGPATIGTPLTGVARSFASSTGVQTSLGLVEFDPATSAGASPVKPSITTNPTGTNSGMFGLTFALAPLPPTPTGIWELIELPISVEEGGEYYEQAEEPETTTLGAVWLDIDAVPSSGGNGGSLQVRNDISFSVTVAVGAEVEHNLVLYPGIRVLNISTDKAARVRAYVSDSQRDADVARAPGTDPDLSTDHGVLLDFVLPAGDLSWTLSPVVDIHTGDGTNVIPLLIKNNGGTANVNVTLTYVRTE